MPEMNSNVTVITMTQNSCFWPMLYLPIAGKLSSRLLITSASRLFHTRSYDWITLSLQ